MILYVNNLNANITAEDLKDIFRLAGPVVSTAISKKKQSKGSSRAGIVEMGSAQAAVNALTQFNGAYLDGAEMLVSEAPGPYRAVHSPSAPADNKIGDGNRPKRA